MRGLKGEFPGLLPWPGSVPILNHYAIVHKGESISVQPHYFPLPVVTSGPTWKNYSAGSNLAAQQLSVQSDPLPVFEATAASLGLNTYALFALSPFIPLALACQSMRRGSIGKGLGWGKVVHTRAKCTGSSTMISELTVVFLNHGKKSWNTKHLCGISTASVFPSLKWLASGQKVYGDVSALGPGRRHSPGKN